MSCQAVINELPLPLAGANQDLDALAIGMVLEGQFDLVLRDEELTPAALGTRDRIVALLAQHGVKP